MEYHGARIIAPFLHELSSNTVEEHDQVADQFAGDIYSTR
ncbi:hypothetical protein CZ765_00960 [Corynebacterium casei]|nr:hypothetical protein CZ765_00960 [Corynebacterium casei]